MSDLQDRILFAVSAAILAAAVVWQVAPVSWTDARGCDDSLPTAATTPSALNAKYETVLGPPGTLVDDELLRATLDLPDTTDLPSGLAVTVNGVRRVFHRSPTGATWMRTE